MFLVENHCVRIGSIFVSRVNFAGNRDFVGTKCREEKIFLYDKNRQQITKHVENYNDTLVTKRGELVVSFQERTERQDMADDLFFLTQT